MRILHVVNSLTHTSIPFEMACAMLNTEDVEIAALYNTQAEADQFARDMGISCRVYGFGYKKNRLEGLIKYIRFLRQCSCDVINTHHSLSGTLVRLFCYGKNKIVHTVHANYHSYSKAQNLLIGSTLERCDAVAFNSSSSQEGLYDWEKKKIRRVRQEVIYNGVNEQRIMNASDDFATAFCRENGIANSDFIFTQVGRLEPVKNPMASLNAVKQLQQLVDPETWNRTRFVYLGNGSQMDAMRDFVRENGLEGRIFLPGVVKRDDVYSWMKRADVLVIPSLYEGFCNTLVEGMTAGLRAIVSDIPIFREILTEDLPITRVAPNDVQAIAEAMCTAAKEPWTDENRRMLNRYALDHYGLSRCIDRYLQLYRQLI